MMGLKKGFLGKNRNLTRIPGVMPETSIAEAKNSFKSPLVFKVDFTLVNGRISIFELGHSSSDNLELEESSYALYKYLRKKYKNVYISGDHPMCITMIEGSIERKFEPPTYVPLEELVNIRTQESIVVIERFEFPIHFTPYKIQQELIKCGSPLVVFDAEPLGCLVAYEKIIMQRLQLLAERMVLNSQETIMDSCAHPTMLIDISKNIEKQIENQSIHFNLTNEESVIIKPAYSCLGMNIFCCKNDTLLEKLKELQRSNHFAESYQRTAEDILGMLQIGKANTLSDKIRYFKQICRETGVDSLLKEPSASDKQDPFFIIQPIKSDIYTTIEHNGKKDYLPTYRTFILVAQSDNSPDNISVILLSKIKTILPEIAYNTSQNIETRSVVAGNGCKSSSFIATDSEIYRNAIAAFNTPQMKKFFSFIFSENNEGLELLQVYFQELTVYWSSINSYPPYQYIFNLPRREAEIRKYQHIMTFHRFHRFYTQYNLADQLATSLILFDLYAEIKQMNHMVSPLYLQEFLNHIEMKNNVIKILSSHYKSNLFYIKLNIKRMLQLFDVYIDAIKFLKKIEYVDAMRDCMNALLEWTALFLPKSKELNRPPISSTLEAKWVEFFREKIARDIVIDLAIKLTNTEQSLTEIKSLKESQRAYISDQKRTFTQWATLYFHSIPITNTMLVKSGAPIEIAEI